MNTTTLGIFETKSEAEAAIADLRLLGIHDADISYMYGTPEGTIAAVDASGNSVGEGAASGAATGAVLGAIAGLVVANGILPGIGTLFVAGPLAGALGLTGAVATTAAGAMTGLAAGGIIGALTGLGVDEAEAKVYEERVKRGGILISARSTDSSATEVFKKHGAVEIREYAKA